jgi:hypothetical protein
MSSRILVIELACLLVFGLSACSDLSNDPRYEEGWAIYFLADPAITSQDVRGRPVNTLLLASSPGITARDLRSYNWTTHEIVFTPPIEARLDSLAYHGYNGSGVPFVVVVNGERIYLGALWHPFSSLMPTCPYIFLILKPRTIRLSGLHEGADPRADMRIYRSLKVAGVLIEERAPAP